MNSQFYVGAPGQKITAALDDLEQYPARNQRDPHHIGLIAIIAETARQIASLVTRPSAQAAFNA